MAAETRNNLVAASQNIQGAQRYLSNIQFPYCAPSEVETLNKATAYIFTDMQTKERHGHAMECYFVTSRRCGALLQWITQVSSMFTFTKYFLKYRWICAQKIYKLTQTMDLHKHFIMSTEFDENLSQ